MEKILYEEYVKKYRNTKNDHDLIIEENKESVEDKIRKEWNNKETNNTYVSWITIEEYNKIIENTSTYNIFDKNSKYFINDKRLPSNYIEKLEMEINNRQIRMKKPEEISNFERNHFLNYWGSYDFWVELISSILCIFVVDGIWVTIGLWIIIYLSIKKQMALRERYLEILEYYKDCDKLFDLKMRYGGRM